MRARGGSASVPATPRNSISNCRPRSQGLHRRPSSTADPLTVHDPSAPRSVKPARASGTRNLPRHTPSVPASSARSSAPCSTLNTGAAGMRPSPSPSPSSQRNSAFMPSSRSAASRSFRNGRTPSKATGTPGSSSLDAAMNDSPARRNSTEPSLGAGARASERRNSCATIRARCPSGSVGPVSSSPSPVSPAPPGPPPLRRGRSRGFRNGASGRWIPGAPAPSMPAANSRPQLASS